MDPARLVQSEWLDQLPADDPRALRARRDLRRVNRWMLNGRIMEQRLREHGGTPRTMLELGAGDGTFMLRLARALAPRWPGVELTLVDRQAIVGERTLAAFRALGWRAEAVAADAGAFLEGPAIRRWNIATANLFLHHLERTDLAALLARIAEVAALFVACEPRRSALALGASRLLWAIGCNDVSRHDAVVSVRAGFCGKELSALWPDAAGWDLHEGPAGPFSHVFVARSTGKPPRL